jgi:hypothetical protein
MPRVIDLKEGQLAIAVRKGFRNWRSHFQESFDAATGLSDISTPTLAHLAQGKDKGTFYLYDLIMNLRNLGSGFEFNELSAKQKMEVIDCYLFLLDRIRFECMKRLKWLESYPGENLTLVEMIVDFDHIAPNLQAKIPILSKQHSDFQEYSRMNSLDQEAFVRKMIPKTLQAIQDQSSTL